MPQFIARVYGTIFLNLSIHCFLLFFFLGVGDDLVRTLRYVHLKCISFAAVEVRRLFISILLNNTHSKEFAGNQGNHAFLFLTCFRPYAWRPFRLSQMNALRFNLTYSPKDQSLKFWRKNIKNWLFWKSAFPSRPFWIFFCFILMKISPNL